MNNKSNSNQDTEVTSSTVEAWCSWCGEHSEHRLAIKRNVGRNIYHCTHCNLNTVRCRYCKNMARAAVACSKLDDGKGERKTGKISKFFTENWDNEFCAEHDGSTPDFRNSNRKIQELGEFKSLMRPRQKNLYSLAKQAGVVIGAAAAVGTGAMIAAPGIAAALGSAGFLGAASTGTAIYTLSGAALTSASLAAIGPAGITIVTAVGAGLGSKAGYGVANSYLKDIPDYEFLFRRAANPDSNHRIIVIDGFLTENHRDAFDWCEGLEGRYLDSPIWYLNWEAKTLQALGDYIGNTGAKKLAFDFAGKGIRAGSKRFANAVKQGGIWLAAADLASNPWHSAMLNAEKAGALLAEAISRCEGKTFTLMGHSLGARVVFFALLALATKEKQGTEKFVRDALLMGAAVGRDDYNSWISASRAVSGKIYNCHSDQDWVLRFLYQTANARLSSPAGLAPIVAPVEEQNAHIANISFDGSIHGHNEWKDKLPEVLNKIGLGS